MTSLDNYQWQISVNIFFAEIFWPILSQPFKQKNPTILGSDAVIWLLSAQIPVQTSMISSEAWKLNFSSISEVVR